MTPAAVAVFVKTPGRSPVKTRLAREIGEADATEFYRRCLRAVEAVLRRADRRRVTPYWAVAEPEAVADPQWRCFEALAQGPGGLGERLDQVYAALLARHPAVVLIGADAPLLSPDLVEAAVAAVTGGGAPFAISRSGDGGFSLFAGARPVPRDVWVGVPYSVPETAAEFVGRLRPAGAVFELPPLDDVDSLADLADLVRSAAGRALLAEQRAVIEFARGLACGGEASA